MKLLEQGKQEMKESRATIKEFARAQTAAGLAAMGEEQLKEILNHRQELNTDRSAEENTVCLCRWLGVPLPPSESLNFLMLGASSHLCAPKCCETQTLLPP